MTATYDYFMHNWVASCRVETSYRTEIAASLSTLKEERRSAQSRPYRAISIKWSGMSRAEHTRIVNALWRAAGQRIYIPLYPDQQITTGSSSGTTINVPTTDSRFAVGAEVLIVGLDGTQERKTVQSFTGSAITLTGALSSTYAAGSRVFPMVLAEILPSSQFDAFTSSVSDVEATFLEVFGPTSLPASATETAPGALGATTSAENAGAPATPILKLSPNYIKPVAGQVVRIVEKNDLGLTSIYSLRGSRASFGWEFAYSAFSKAAAGDLLRFFESRKGRLLPFWFVNPAIDFTLASIATTHVDVSPVGNLADYQDSLEYLAVVMKDGTIYVRKIASVSSGGGNYIFTLTNALPALSSTDIDRVTTAHFCRFGKDSLLQDAITDTVSDFTLSIVEILDESKATEIVFPADVVVGPSCSASCEGQWSICYVAYMMSPKGISFDCPECLIGKGTILLTMNPGDACNLVMLNFRVSDGFFQPDGAWNGGTGACVSLTALCPVTIRDTGGEFVEVYGYDTTHGQWVDNLSPYGTPAYPNVDVFACIAPGWGSPGARPCASSGKHAEDVRHTLGYDAVYGTTCIPIPIDPTWFA